MLTWAITGPGPNPLTARCDEAVMVQAPSTAAIQAVHLIAVHGLCAVVDAVVAESPPRLAPRPVHHAADLPSAALTSELTG